MRLLRTEPTARIGSMALTQVGLSLQTACPRPRGTQADSPEFLRALGARPESARSEYGPKSSHPDPCCALQINPSTDRIPPVSTCSGDRLNSPADPPHLTLGHQTTLGPLNVRWGGGEKRDSYIRTRVNVQQFAGVGYAKQVTEVMKSHQYFWVHA